MTGFVDRDDGPCTGCGQTTGHLWVSGGVLVPRCPECLEGKDGLTSAEQTDRFRWPLTQEGAVRRAWASEPEPLGLFGRVREWFVWLA